MGREFEAERCVRTHISYGYAQHAHIGLHGWLFGWLAVCLPVMQRPAGLLRLHYPT